MHSQLDSASSVRGSPGLRVAYLVNEYPKVSHSFIRREIIALERAGCEVVRYASRGWDTPLVDDADVAERARTGYLLQVGAMGLLFDVAACALLQPHAWLVALRLAWRMSRRADRSLPYHLVYLAQACRLSRLLRRSNVRHLHAHFATNPAEVAMLQHALGGPPFSFTVHGPEDFDKPEFLGMARKIEHAAFVVAISSFCRSQLMRWCPSAQWAKLHVVHCGLDASYKVAKPVTDVPAAAAADVFVCVGRLCEQKGQLLLLEALVHLRNEGVKPRLVLAGDGEMRQVIEARVLELGLNDQVHITGWLSGEQVRHHILAARALVLPSFAEGLPVVLMEALALSRPVITTHVAGIPELVRSGIDGWLVAPGDAAALAAALNSCLQTDAQTLDAMGEAGRARVLEQHDADREAAKLLQLFAVQHGLRTQRETNLAEAVA